MAEFGWAYVTGLLAGGVSGSVQVNDGDLRLSGSKRLIYNETSGALNLSGALNVSGTITANQYNVNVINRSVINLSASGDTKFGDTLDDTHQYTGSVYITGSGNLLVLKGLITGSANSSAHFLAIDSDYNVILTSSDGGPGGNGLIRTYTNPANNRIITSIDSEGINAEANLLFNGSILTVTGDLSASGGVSASVGQYTQLTASEGLFSELTIGTSTIKITPSAISGVETLTSTNLGGVLTTSAQPNVTSVGNLTGLTVDTNVLVADADTNRVGVGITNPRKPLEVLHSSAKQLRLSQQQAGGLDADVYTDFQTNDAGYLLIDPSGARIGIGTNSPAQMFDVEGNMRVGGNLYVTGALHAKTSEFIVSANNITFGDSSADTLTFNAASASAPNGLNFDSNTWVLDTANNRVGIGTTNPGEPLHIVTAGNSGVEIESTSGAPTLTFDMPSNEEARILFKENTELRASIVWDSEAPQPHAMIFKGKGTNTEIMRLDPAGNVGIATASPAAQLHVAGDTIITEDLAVTGSVTGSALTDGTVVITGGNISSVTTITATNVNATNLAGTLTTAAQPNVTSVGNLTGLIVDTNVLVVDAATDRVGIGMTDPRKPLEVLHSSAKQLRLSQQQAAGLDPDIYTDFQTNASGYLLIDPSGARLGIGTSSPKAMLDVEGNMRVGGNLEITGALRAKVSEFIVSANNITFGDSATDTLIFNAASGTVMNGLNWDGNTWVMDSDNNRIGVGVAHPQAKTHILSNSQNQLRLGYDLSSYVEMVVDSRGDLELKPTGAYITASAGFYSSGSAILGNSCVDVVTCNGQLTASCGVSGTVGLLTHLTSTTMTDGIATITGGNISGVGTLTATNVAGTLTTAAQGNVTSLGTLSSLAVTGDLTVDTTTFKVNSSTNRVGIGVTDPTKPLEISSSAGGLRLTFSRAVPFQTSLVYSDLSTDSSGKLVLESSGNKTKVVGGLEITGLASGLGVTTKYLALDSGNNIVLTQSVAPGIETRNRRVVTANATLSSDDYYIGIAASSNVTITLLGAEDLANGQTFTFKDEGGTADSYVFRINASGSQLIDGHSTVYLESEFASINLYTNGVDKYFIF